MHNCFYRIGCKALIYDESKTKVLLFREENGKYDFPGGGLGWEEEPQTAITRELQEESGLEVVRIDSKPSYMITGEVDILPKDYKEKFHIALVFYETTVKNLEFTPSEECQGLGFFTKEEALQLDCYSTVKKFFEQI